MSSKTDGVRITHAFPNAFVNRQQRRAAAKGVDFPFKRTEVMQDLAEAAGFRDAQTFQRILKQMGERGRDQNPQRYANHGLSDTLRSNTPVDEKLEADKLPEVVGANGAIETPRGSIDLIYSPTDTEKPDLIQRKALGFLMRFSHRNKAGQTVLPKAHLIGMGPTFVNVARLIADTLGGKDRNQIAAITLCNDREHAINPFDTMPGARYPTPTHLNRLLDLLSCLVRPGDSPLSKAIVSLLTDLLQRLFEIKDDDNVHGDPNRYTFGVNERVDAAIQTTGLDVRSDETTWWWVADALAAKGHETAALWAQRHAVPRLEDLMLVLHEPSIQEVFGSVKLGNGEFLTNYMEKNLAFALKEYAVLCAPTQLDTVHARVVAFDLDRCSPRSSLGAKQSAVMHLVAACHTPQMHENLHDLAHDMPRARLPEANESAGLLMVDQWQRWASSPDAHNHLVVQMRESRKSGVDMCIGTRELDSFEENITDLATAVLVTGPSVKSEEPQRIIQKLGLHEEAEEHLQTVASNETGSFNVYGRRLLTNGPMEFLHTAPEPPAVLTWAFTCPPHWESNHLNNLAQQYGFLAACRHLAG